jgi:hypothetical protein
MSDDGHKHASYGRAGRCRFSADTVQHEMAMIDSVAERFDSLQRARKKLLCWEEDIYRVKNERNLKTQTK